MQLNSGFTLMTTMLVALSAVRALEAEKMSSQPSRHLTRPTRSTPSLKNNLVNLAEDNLSQQVPSLRSKLETGVSNPSLYVSMLVLIVLMIVSPSIVASVTTTRPFEANLARGLNLSENQGARSSKLRTSNEGRLSERFASVSRRIGLTV